MQRKISLIFALMIGLLTWAEVPLVYVLNLNDEVDAKMRMITRRACDEAVDNGASLMIFHINTYGGAVDAADSIRTAILRLPIPTVAFVDPNAASAGSLITLACDSVYMAPGASYGASSVVDGTGAPMPDKYQSYMKTIMRATAESHGKVWSEADSAWTWRRDPKIAEAFVTVDSVLALTPEEAIKVGYAEGKATSVDEVIAHHIDGPYRTMEYKPTATDHILGFLSNAAVKALLVALILGGIFMEMKTGGLGLAGGVAFVAAVLYFLPSLVTGSIAPWVIILFIIGLILLAFEFFVIPGFGFCGIAGIVAVLASLVGGLIDGNGWETDLAGDIARAVVITASGGLIAVAVIWFLTSKYGPQRVRRVSELQTELKDSDGYVGVDTSQGKFVGQIAKTVTDLRPSGKIVIGNHEFDAVSLSGFIDAHREVKVERFENAQLYVRLI